MASSIQDVTEANFDDLVLKSDKPVLVNFWNQASTAASALNPVLETLAEKYADKAVVARINIDQCPTIASRYGVRTLPYVSIFKDSEMAFFVIGAQAAQNVEKMLAEAV